MNRYEENGLVISKATRGDPFTNSASVDVSFRVRNGQVGLARDDGGLRTRARPGPANASTKIVPLSQ